MNRRNFISAIGVAVAGSTLDPERALWIPGAKTISVPKPSLKLFTYLGRRWGNAGLLFAGSYMQSGFCTSADIPVILKNYYEPRIRPLPYEGNETRYHQLRGVTRLHYAG